AVDQHSPGDVGKIELFSVVRAQNMLGFAEMRAEQVFEFFQQLRFFAVERSGPKISFVLLKRKKSDRNAYDFSKFGPNSGPVIKFFRREFVFSLVLGFQLEKVFFFIAQILE